MATLKRKGIGSKKQALTKKKTKLAPAAPKAPMTVEEEMDAMIREEEEAAESGLTLQDLAASDSEEEENGEASGENQYYKNVGDDPIFEDDEELLAYIESKKRGLLRPSINNKKALQLKLLEITDGAPWPQTLQITAEEDLECDIQDDLAREGAFYKQALWAAETGLGLCDDFDMKHVRPTDYYAEMLKTDKHMYRVRQQIALDKKKVEVKEQRRAQRDSIKYGKLIDKQKRKDKDEEKRKQKRLTTALKEKYKDRNADTEFDLDVEDEDGPAGHQSEKPKGLAGLRGKAFKRRAKDEKFGFGKGKQKSSKYNTRESYLGLESLGSARKGLHNARRQGRPGKAKRAQSKSKARR